VNPAVEMTVAGKRVSACRHDGDLLATLGMRFLACVLATDTALEILLKSNWWIEQEVHH
jgi:hypothetical protein